MIQKGLLNEVRELVDMRDRIDALISRKIGFIKIENPNDRESWRIVYNTIGKYETAKLYSKINHMTYKDSEDWVLENFDPDKRNYKNILYSSNSDSDSE